MKKNIFVAITFSLGIMAFGASDVQAMSETQKAAELTRLQAQIEELQTMLEMQSLNVTPEAIKKSTSRPNLVVQQVSVDKDQLGGNSMGVALPEQTITMTVANDVIGYHNTERKTFDYVVTLYEKRQGTDKKTKIKATGKIVIPAGTETTTFEVVLEGGTPFSQNVFERIFYPVVTLDQKRKIKETNERDNTFTAEGTTWIMEYYKG
jgi:hypothetical protein